MSNRWGRRDDRWGWAPSGHDWRSDDGGDGGDGGDGDDGDDDGDD